MELDFVRESYATLDGALEDFLSNKTDLFSAAPRNDFLEGLMSRIDSAKLSDNLDSDDKDDLQGLESALYHKIISHFRKDYSVNEEEIANIFENAQITRFYIQKIYDLFYTGKREILINFLANFIFDNKNDFAKQYKAQVSKKDYEYYSLRKDLSLSKPEYYCIIIKAVEIVSDILEDTESFDFKEVLLGSNLEVEDVETIYSLFDGSSDNFSRFIDTLIGSINQDRIALEVKDKLGTMLKNAK
jgi:hypothetical protein